jgi:hypothetical protein
MLCVSAVAANQQNSQITAAHMTLDCFVVFKNFSLPNNCEASTITTTAKKNHVPEITDN